MIRFLYIALGSIAEIETQLEIATRLGYIQIPKEIETQLFRLKVMTLKLIQKLQQRMNANT